MHIKEIIDKLQSVDVKDIKNIDFNQVQDNIKGKPDILIIIVLIVLSLSATIYIYMDSQKKITALTEEHSKLTEQQIAADENKLVQTAFDKYIEEFPTPIIVDDLVDKLSVFAINRNIKIISFSPAQEKATDYTKIASINIHVQAEDYSELIDFLKDVENAPFAIRIEQWSAKLNSGKGGHSSRRSRRQTQTTTNASTNPSISANIEIAAISLILDEKDKEKASLH